VIFFVVGGKCSKTDKVVKREICSIQTKGTKRLSFIDGDATDCCSQFLLALCEKVRVTADADCMRTYGGKLASVMRHQLCRESAVSGND